MDFLPHALDGQAVERLDRALRLAVDRAERGEVVMADEMRRSLSHRLRIERNRDMPDLPHFQRRWRAAVEDSIEITPADTGKARMPVVRHRLDLRNADR